jgi:hypothetical protein
MERTAGCQCGQFRVATTIEPDAVNICHCADCQRRSGVPWTSNAYFRRSGVTLSGAYRTYTREAQEGRKFHNHFCPDCGATVCWTLDIRPDRYGVAVGSFNDPSFPAPTYSVYERSKYRWVVLPDGLQHFPHGKSVA